MPGDHSAFLALKSNSQLKLLMLWRQNDYLLLKMLQGSDVLQYMRLIGGDLDIVPLSNKNIAKK